MKNKDTKGATHLNKVSFPSGNGVFITNNLNIYPDKLVTNNIVVYTATNPKTHTKLYCCVPKVAQQLKNEGYTLTASIYKMKVSL